MIATIITAAQQGDSTAEIVTASFAGVAVVLGTIGTIWLRRIDEKAKTAASKADVTADSIGQKNGRGDVFKMLRDLQDSVSDVSDRVGTMDRRLLVHEESVGRRLDGMHESVKSTRAVVIDVAGRVSRLEGQTP